MLSDLTNKIIFDLVNDLASGNFQSIEADGRIGRLTTDELKDAILEYGCTVLPLPKEAVEKFDVCEIESQSGTFLVDIPLWTSEEDPSDLTLSLSVNENNICPEISIEDLHVL